MFSKSFYMVLFCHGYISNLLLLLLGYIKRFWFIKNLHRKEHVSTGTNYLFFSILLFCRNWKYNFTVLLGCFHLFGYTGLYNSLQFGFFNRLFGNNQVYEKNFLKSIYLKMLFCKALYLELYTFGKWTFI